MKEFKEIVDLAISKGYVNKKLTAPTQKLAQYLTFCDIQKWLREKKDIAAFPMIEKDFKYSAVSTKIRNTLDFSDFEYSLDEKKEKLILFDSYEDALSRAIINGIDLIDRL